MSTIKLSAPIKGHLLPVVESLIRSGWSIEKAPVDGRILRNGQKIVLKTAEHDIRFRLFVYKVGPSGRGRPEERRVEMTSKVGLTKVTSFPDVVLGVETDLGIFVGFNAVRLLHGGDTHNASSFFNIDGLHSLRKGTLRIDKRKSRLFPSGVEHHAFFYPDKLAEYFFNRRSIHSGTYGNDGVFSGLSKAHRSKPQLVVDRKIAAGDELVLRGPQDTRQSNEPRIAVGIIERAERGEFHPRTGRRKRVTPEEFSKIQRIMEENGALGEQFAIDDERKRLQAAGRHDLAGEVKWVSKESVGEGYDIQSFESDGTKRFIEVKTSVASQRVFDMSDNEWRTSCRLGMRYFIYRVSSIRSKPSISRYQNPSELEKIGRLRKSPNGWRITLE